MAGFAGLTLGFRADANKRVSKFTVMVKSTGTASTQQAQYAKIPAAANAAGILGVTVDHFIEPGGLYFVPQGTDPSTVTGTTPTSYSLAGRIITLQVNGVARCYCAAAVAQGDVLVVADTSGRVFNLASAAITGGTIYYAVGIAQHGTAAINDVVQGNLGFYQGVA